MAPFPHDPPHATTHASDHTRPRHESHPAGDAGPGGMPQPDGTRRRSLLALVIGVVAGLLTLALGAYAFSYLPLSEGAPLFVGPALVLTVAVVVFGCVWLFLRGLAAVSEEVEGENERFSLRDIPKSQRHPQFEHRA